MQSLKAALAARRLRRSGGFTLVELAMVLAIIGLILAGIMMAFTGASTGQKTADATSELGMLQQVVRSLYAGQPDYTGLSGVVVAQSGQMPKKWVAGTIAAPTGTGLSSPFTAPVTIAPATNTVANDVFTIKYTNLPSTACSRMATMDLGTGLLSVVVNGATAVVQRALTPAEANTECTNASTITWTFF